MRLGIVTRTAVPPPSRDSMSSLPPHIISIRTRETEEGSEILVEDNGPGFDPAVARTPNTALANIRERLEMMCGGRLEITPRPEGGTAVRILIPGKAGRNEGG